MRLNKEEHLSHLNTWKHRYQVGDDAIVMTLWGTQVCISVPWVYSKNYFLFPATTLTHTSTLFISCHAIHFLWLISYLLSLPISNLPHQSWTITKSILRQMLWTDTQQMQKDSRSKSLLFDPLVPGTRVLDIPCHLSPLISHTSGVKSGFHFPKCWPPLLFQCGILPGRAGRGTCLVHPGRLPCWSAPVDELC